MNAVIPASPSSWHDGTRATLVQGLRDACQRWGDRTYLDVCHDRCYSFNDIDILSNRYAHGLAALGVERGTPVCAMLDNSTDCVALLFAALKLEALFVPLNTALKGDFLRHQVLDSTATVLICEEAYLEAVLAIRSEIAPVSTIVVRASEAAVEGALGLEQVLSSDDRPLAPSPDPADTCMLIYTSGTTGPSKACMISHNYMMHFPRDLCFSSEMTEADCLYACAPLFHVSALGMIFTSLIAGNRIALDRRFSITSFWGEIRRTGTTVANIFGAMLAMLARSEETENSRACHGQIKTILGMPFTPELQAAWRDRFGVSRARNSGFGMSEACLIFVTPPDDNAMPAGASGKAAPDMEVAIHDDNDCPCPPGVSGELVIRPKRPNIMFDGYWNRPGDTVAAWRNLWFHTGDIGRIDENGYFFFVDRKKDYIRRRGENISTFEMEAIFMRHPALAEVAVHAVASDLTEDDVKLTAVLAEGVMVTHLEVCQWAVERVPHFALPRYIEFRSSLPYNASSKAMKYQLRDEGVTPATWDRDKSGVTFKR